MREVVLDTETTGLNPRLGDRIVEIGCIELIDGVPTGQRYHTYLNPERDMPPGAFAVHGLSSDFLADKPLFAAVVEEFLAFVGDSRLIIHNAPFDIGFLNAELERLERPGLTLAQAVDTVMLARQAFPGAQANLDALCKRFGVDNSNRTLHGALKDADLLARVYIELTGGRQAGLDLASAATIQVVVAERQVRPPRPHAPTAEEMAAHALFLAKINAPIWAA
jgi:DNA polymerase-3 subunit epsilon